MNPFIQFKILRSWWSMKFERSSFSKWDRDIEKRIAKERSQMGRNRLIEKGGERDE